MYTMIINKEFLCIYIGISLTEVPKLISYKSELLNNAEKNNSKQIQNPYDYAGLWSNQKLQSHIIIDDEIRNIRRMSKFRTKS